MALLATPSLGILISALTLGEGIDRSLVAGVILIGVGIALAATSSMRTVATSRARASGRAS
jgi:drug/metabolite transporter (DMT)-like permease